MMNLFNHSKVTKLEEEYVRYSTFPCAVVHFLERHTSTLKGLWMNAVTLMNGFVPDLSTREHADIGENKSPREVGPYWEAVVKTVAPLMSLKEASLCWLEDEDIRELQGKGINFVGLCRNLCCTRSLGFDHPFKQSIISRTASKGQ